jgi:chitosanase
LTAPSAVTSVVSSTAPVRGPSSHPGWLDGDRRRRADQLISTFENSTTAIRYDYAENVHDGRGITSGRAGFTTSTCDARDVVDRYGAAVPGNGLSRFLPELRRLCAIGSDATDRLPAAAYIESWRSAAGDPAFRQAQDAIVDRDSFQPAMTAADALSLQSPLARAELYDTAIQHGTDSDSDSLGAVVSRTVRKVGAPQAVGEASWLNSFFTERIATLRHADPSKGWRDTTDRVECMRRLAQAGQADMPGPLDFTVYGDRFSIA